MHGDAAEGAETSALRSIRELARRAGGLTLRTIRFYEEKGLLVPSAVGPGGRRRYGADALVALRRIRMLRESGCALDEIGRVLGDLAERPTAKKSRQRAHAELLAKVRGCLVERVRELEGLVRTLDRALISTDHCARCPSEDCAGCGVLARWMRFGAEADSE